MTAKKQQAIKRGAVVLCWFPDFTARPWRAKVISVHRRMIGAAGNQTQNGLLITVESRICKRCRRYRLEQPTVVLGHEWFDAEYARERRAKGERL